MICQRNTSAVPDIETFVMKKTWQRPKFYTMFGTFILTERFFKLLGAVHHFHALMVI